MWKLNSLVGRCRDKAIPVGYREISTATGISTSTIYEIMHGRTTRVDFTTVDRLLTFFSDALGQSLTIGDLLEWQRENATTINEN